MAKQKIRTLSEKDLQLLEWVIQEARSRFGDMPLRSPSSPYIETDADPQAPEVYVAKPQSGSIPAMVLAGHGTGTGTGVPAIYDTPGMAYCDIYRITNDNDGGPALIAIGIERPVYNVSIEEIDPSDGYVVIKRSKQGLWLAEHSAAVASVGRYAMLRSDLEQGGSCIIEEYTDDGSDTWCHVGERFTAYDPLGEYQGTKDYTGCEFTDNPYGGRKLIKRITCNGFYCLLGVCGATGTGS